MDLKEKEGRLIQLIKVLEDEIEDKKVALKNAKTSLRKVEKLISESDKIEVNETE